MGCWIEGRAQFSIAFQLDRSDSLTNQIRDAVLTGFPQI
jgi:hypothetical protein